MADLNEHSAPVVGRLLAAEAQLRGCGVRALALVGSVARGDCKPDSDVDVLVDIEPGRKFSLIDLSGLRLLLGDMLARETDVLIRDDLPVALRRRLEEDAVGVF